MPHHCIYEVCFLHSGLLPLRWTAEVEWSVWWRGEGEMCRYGYHGTTERFIRERAHERRVPVEALRGVWLYRKRAEDLCEQGREEEGHRMSDYGTTLCHHSPVAYIASTQSHCELQSSSIAIHHVSEQQTRSRMIPVVDVHGVRVDDSVPDAGNVRTIVSIQTQHLLSHPASEGRDRQKGRRQGATSQFPRNRY